MAIPKRIPIARDGGDHSMWMGFYALNVEDNQFWGRVVAAPPEEAGGPIRWYAVLHKFDGWGRHLETDTWFAGVSDDVDGPLGQRAHDQLEAMVADLGEIEWGDIKIGLFQVEFDGRIFGLLDVSATEDGRDCVVMEPGRLRFAAPWNGSYVT